jgi:hypothetical protein
VEVCSFTLKSMKNIVFKFVGPPASSVEAMTLRFMHYIRVRYFVFRIMGFFGPSQTLTHPSLQFRPKQSATYLSRKWWVLEFTHLLSSAANRSQVYCGLPSSAFRCGQVRPVAIRSQI